MAINQTYDTVARIGVASSDVDFTMRAFADYCERKQQNLNEMLDLLQESIMLVPDDIDDYTTAEQLVINKLQEAHPNYNFDQTVLLDEGYTTLRDCIKLTVNEVANVDSAESNEIRTHNAAGALIGSITYSDLAQGLQAQLHSLVGLVACNRAQLYSNISDKLQAFNDTMNSTFANAYSDISSSLGYYKALLQQNLSPVAYLKNVSSALSLDALAADNSTVIPLETDITKFTGASPAGPLNFESFTSATSTVVNTGLKVVKGIFSAVKNVVSPIVKKAVSTVKETLVDPYDIYVLDDKDPVASVAQFSYYGSATLPETLWGPYQLDQEHYDYLKNYYLSHPNWFKLGLVGGELLFRVKSISDSKALSCEYRYRPKSVSSEFIRTIKTIVGSANRLTDNMISSIAAVTSSPDFYLSTDSAEDDLYAGFYRGARFDKTMLSYAGAEARNTGGVLSSEKWENAWTPDKLTTSIATNKDFVNITSGLIDHPGAGYIVANYSVLGTVADSDKQINIDSIVYNAISCMSNNLLAEYDNPTDFPFFPYRYDKEDFSNGKFAIKTDAQNFNAFNTFITSAIIVTVGVLTAAAIGCAAKRVMNKLKQRALERKSVLDQKMWNGERLSNKEANRYRRASKKLEGSSALSSALQTNSQSALVGSVDNSSSTLSGIESLKSAIYGPTVN